MGIEIKLLVVEDDDGQYETYTDAASEMSNPQEDFQFVLTREKDFSSAQQALLSKGFDAAIVDLNLNASDASEASGNRILKEIIGNLRFPVFVVSGNLGMLDEEIRLKESAFLTFYSREKPNAEIFGQIKKIYSTGITSILGGRGMIETSLTDIFWNHLANDLNVWLSKGTSSEKALLRYAVSHLNEYLDLSSDESNFYDEAEFYIKPPIRKYIATGDIIESKDNSSRYIVLSPACDVEVRDVADNIPIINAKRITLAKLIPVGREGFLTNNIIRGDDNSEKRENILKEIISGQRDKYVFLPEYNPLKASVADLQNLYTVEFNEYLTEFVRIATVAIPFLKDIQSRFSSYYARQGQPDLDKKTLVKKHKVRLSPVSNA